MLSATVFICALMVFAGKSDAAVFVFLGGMVLALATGECR